MTQYVKVYRTAQVGNSYTPYETEVWVGKLNTAGDEVALLYKAANASANSNITSIDDMLDLLRATEA